MISKRLMRLCGKSRKYIAFTVLAKWISLLCGVGIFWTIGRVVDKTLIEDSIGLSIILFALICVAMRFLAELLAPRFSHTAASRAKKNLRKKVYDKLISLGTSYNMYISTAGIVQTAGEGIESLDSYFGRYIPQLFLCFIGSRYTFCFYVVYFFKGGFGAYCLCSVDSYLYHCLYENCEKSNEKALECIH